MSASRHGSKGTKQNEFRYRPAQDRTALQRFGELTAAENFLVVLPLFIVLGNVRSVRRGA
jgi:hypothetical protein